MDSFVSGYSFLGFVEKVISFGKEMRTQKGVSLFESVIVLAVLTIKDWYGGSPDWPYGKQCSGELGTGK